MDIQLAEQRIFALVEKLTLEQARLRAMDRRADIFVSGLVSLFQRPKTEEIELIGSQERFEPFWHVMCSTRHVYDRTRKFSVPVSGPEVQSITYKDEEMPVVSRAFGLTAVEHCREEDRQELFADGLSGDKQELGNLVGGSKNEVADLSAFAANDKVMIVPPEVRASFVVRQLLQQMLKPVQADVVHEESVKIEATDLYYRPVFAFEFRWKPKDKTGVVEIDGVSGEMRNAKALLQKLNIPVSRDALFDIGADTIGMLVPGANIAVKLAKVALDAKK
ncbi:MAG TPA: hypothetical protein VJ754_06935 [Anaerolineae bacterium]|nr:hypothetical protein [Anaerolineae bacterium]